VLVVMFFVTWYSNCVMCMAFSMFAPPGLVPVSQHALVPSAFGGCFFAKAFLARSCFNPPSLYHFKMVFIHMVLIVMYTASPCEGIRDNTIAYSIKLYNVLACIMYDRRTPRWLLVPSQLFYTYVCTYLRI
jgi:hypothetical protein